MIGDRPDAYDREGRPITAARWGQLRDNLINVIVARAAWGADEDDPEIVVSTVWLGIDHSYLAQGPPIIFETMVFGGPLDGEIERYATEEQAHLGHARMVERVADARMGRAE